MNYEDVMTPEEYAQLVKLGGMNQGLDDSMAQQLALAKQMRVDHIGSGSNGGLRDAGRRVAPPHWMELAGGLGSNYMAGKAENEAHDMRKERNANDQTQRRMVMDAILRQQQQRTQQMQGGPLQLPQIAPPAPAGQDPMGPGLKFGR